MNGFFLVALGGAIGASMRYGAGNFGGEQAIWLLVGVGVLGAFTTFSTFSRETIYMFMEGETLKGLSFIALNMVGAIGAFAIGLFTLRRLLS